MASSNFDDDEILFIEEIRPSSSLPRTPKTPVNIKKWRQQTVTHVRSPLAATNHINQKNPKSEFSSYIGSDINAFDLSDLSLLSPQITNFVKKQTKREEPNDVEIIGLDDEDEDEDLKPYIKNELKREAFKMEINKNEKKIFEAPSIIPKNINNYNELMSLLSERKLKKLTKKQQAQQLQNQANTDIINDPNQFQTGFNEDAETAQPAEIYKMYEPKKLKFGMPHPDQVVETSSLASVEPPEIYYELKMSKIIHEKAKLSALQLEAVVYACQSHERLLATGQRCGFFVGDGAGVGKGRTIAGIILEGILSKRTKAIWLSISSDLKIDAQRDLTDIGVSKEFEVKWLNDFDYKPIKMSKGILFITYSSLIAKKKKPGKGEYSTRFEQIIKWAGEESYDGLIIFDESHKAKNLEPEKGKPTQVGMAVRDLQDKLPNARVVYASATGASESKNLAYMTRLGLWGEGQPFRDVGCFIDFVEEHGVSAMEVVALDLKWQGIFLARQLSFAGATFEIREVDLELEFQITYDKSVKLWVKLKNYIMEYQELMKYKERSLWANFWAAHQRFFRYLCIASKVKSVVQITKEAVAEGKSVVIGLQSTGEAQSVKQSDAINEEEIFSTAYGVISDVLSSIPDPMGNKAKTSKSSSNSQFDNEQDDFYDSPRPKKKFKGSKRDQLVAMQEDMFAHSSINMQKLVRVWNEINSELNSLKVHLPSNSLDQIINDLGGPDNVAEMTGRKSHIVCNEYDKSQSENESDSESSDKENSPISKTKKVKRKFKFEKRSAANQKTLNVDEKNLFMNGDKRIAIISDAASCGISLHASNEVTNRTKRLHITLELPWSADKAVQQFGRTHRSNQASAPDYMFLISQLAGEKRFASSVAKRIESMNALTHGDRNATKARDLSSFNLEGKHGNKSVNKLVFSINQEKPVENVDIPEYDGNFFEDAKKALDGIEIGVMNSDKGCTVKTFLNRILGCEVKIQNKIFDYFEAVLNSEIDLAKKENRYDEGINEIDLTKKDIIGETSETFLLKDNREVSLHSIQVKAGMPWSEVFELYEKNKSEESNINGFYFQYGHEAPVLAVKASTGYGKYMIFSPALGKFNCRLYHEDLVKNYKKAYKMNIIETTWTRAYQKTHNLYVHILGGSILGIFLKIKEIFNNYTLRICRVYTGEKKRVIGISVPGTLLSKVKSEISLLRK